jgi:hypothetical protein
MTADQIIKELNALAEKITKANPQAVVSHAQLGQLAAVVDAQLEAAGLAQWRVRRKFRLGIFGMVFDESALTSSKDLSFGEAVAMCSRWCDGRNPYEPTPECVKEIPILLRELALRSGQMEMGL